MTTLELAKKYLDSGFAPIPIPKQSKAPILKGWPDLRLKNEDLAIHFSNGNNIGVLLGKPSGNLIDIDCDCPVAVALASRFLPPAKFVFGRKSKPRSHFLYHVDADIATEKFIDEDGSTIVEIRSTGAQTVFPPSIHPSGEVVEWCDSSVVDSKVTSEALRRAVKCLAAAVLMAKNYPPAAGSRHQIAMALSGGLQRSGWSPDDAVNFVEAVCVGAGDEELKDRVRAAKDTSSKLKSNAPVIGFRRLMSLVNEKVVTRIRSILEITDGRLATEEQHQRYELKRQSGIELKLANTAISEKHPHNLTDVGNSEFFIRRNTDKILFCPEFGKFLLWDAIFGYWNVDQSGAATTLAKQTLEDMMVIANSFENEKAAEILKAHVQKSEMRRNLESMLALSKCEIPIATKYLDSDPYLFNCANGTVHLQTGELKPHDKKNLITKRSYVEFDPESDCPTWLGFLDDIFGTHDDLIPFIQRAVGYSITGEIKEQCFFFNYGTGANGKSTFLNTILAVAGDYGKQTSPDLLVTKGDSVHPTGMTELQGIRFASSIEVEEGRRFAEVIVKMLTGGDVITARKMHCDFFSFNPTHKIWLAANHKPSIRGTDHAIWRRVRLIPFEVTFSEEEQDKELSEKLKSEYPGILAWMVEGAVAWYQSGLQAPKCVLDATQEYREEMDNLSNFADAHCVFLEDASCFTGDLYESYKKWAEQSGEYCLPRKMFLLKFKERFPKLTQVESTGNRLRFLGVGLKMEGME